MKKHCISFLEILLIIIIVFEVGFVFFGALLRPVINFDALATWAWKAKVLFYQPQEFFNSGSDLFLGGDSHQNYPLLIPLIIAGIYMLFGQVNDVFIGFVFALHFLALIAFIYFSLRLFISRKLSLIFTTFLCTIPLLSYHGFSSYADLPLTLYFTVAAVCLFKYMHAAKPHTSDLIVAGVFAGLSTWVKNEGLMLAGVICIVFILFMLYKKAFKQQLRNFLFFIVPFVMIFAPLFIFKLYFGLGWSNISGPFLLGFHPEVFISVIQQIFVSHSFHIWAGIFLLILLFYRRKVITQPYIYMLLIILGVICAYTILYVFTPLYEFAVDGTVIGRNFLTIIPISIFLAGLLMQPKNLKQ